MFFSKDHKMLFHLRYLNISEFHFLPGLFGSSKQLAAWPVSGPAQRNAVVIRSVWAGSTVVRFRCFRFRVICRI